MADETQEIETLEAPPVQKDIISEINKQRIGKTEQKEETIAHKEATEKKEIVTSETKPDKKTETKPEEKKVEVKSDTPIPVQKTIDEQIAEKTGGKYKTFEEFDKYANRAERKLSERIIRLAELEEKGVDIYDIIKYESKGYDKLNPEKTEDAKKLLFEKWSEEDKGITAKELEYKFKKEYGILNKSDEDLTEDEKEEKEISQITLMRSAKQAQQFMLDKKKEFELPKNNTNQPTEQELQGLIDQWKGSVTPVVNEHKEEIFSVTEGKEKKDFKFVVTDEERNKTLQTMINPSTIVQRHIKDGKTDMNGLRRTAFIVENFDKILSAYGEDRYNAGLKNVIESIENPSTDSRGTRIVESTITNPAKAAAADKAKRASAQ